MDVSLAVVASVPVLLTVCLLLFFLQLGDDDPFDHRKSQFLMSAQLDALEKVRQVFYAKGVID